MAAVISGFLSGETSTGHCLRHPEPGRMTRLGRFQLLQPHAEYKLPNLSEADFTLLLQRHGVQLTPDDVRRFYRGLQAHALYLDFGFTGTGFGVLGRSS